MCFSCFAASDSESAAHFMLTRAISFTMLGTTSWRCSRNQGRRCPSVVDYCSTPTSPRAPLGSGSGGLMKDTLDRGYPVFV
ncbi:unnamed protein product [Cuscuta campestris]|uniref:Uncharacterized protein n=1 Tax=Cuscuta campestris TaxID=132261 RepID=A0A484KGZ6_9ASTE|nr:unnamed protein product [Cuscuta campestris]